MSVELPIMWLVTNLNPVISLDIIAILAIIDIMAKMDTLIKSLSAKQAKYEFGYLIDLARVEPIAVTKHGRPVIAVLAYELFERVWRLNASSPQPTIREPTARLKKRKRDKGHQDKASRSTRKA